MKKDREFFLKEAEKLINGQRAKEYGPAKKNHQRIADIWTILLDKKLNGAITPVEVGNFVRTTNLFHIPDLTPEISGEIAM